MTNMLRCALENASVNAQKVYFSTKIADYHMANKKKPIYYPRREGEVSPYYSNLADKLAGPLGVKYGTTGDTINQLNAHKVQIPAKKSKAYADAQIAKHSNAIKKAELAEGKKNAMRELDRITRLAHWDEKDAEHLGIRKERSEKDLKTLKPVITSTKSLPDKIQVKYAKKGMDGVIVETLAEDLDKDKPQWIKIGEDQFSPIEDRRLNKTNQPENRFYRLRYIKNDVPIGQYSEIVHVVAQIYKAVD
jgi:hypothetical protein